LQQPSAEPEVVLVEDSAGLRDVCQNLRSATTFSFDTEFIRERSYLPQLCLVQAAAPGFVALIDALKTDIKPFWDLVLDPSLTKVVHAGTQDLEMCYLRTHTPAANIFDVQVAAGFAGLVYPLSYGRLVEESLQVHIPQSKTLSDWSRRPLSPGQLRYAVEDVEYLVPLWTLLRGRLCELGREDWMREEMQTLVDQQRSSADPREAWRRVRGWRRLGRQTLASLRELAAWRESAAAEADVPPRTFLRDEAMRAVARIMPPTVRKLADVRGFPRPVARRNGEELIRILDAVREMPRESWPQAAPREGRSLDRSLIDRAIATGQALCQKHGLTHELLASRSNYIDLASSLQSGRKPQGDLRLMSGWRRGFAGEKVAAVLQARMSKG
jgi:ribonuclease D